MRFGIEKELGELIWECLRDGDGGSFLSSWNLYFEFWIFRN